VGFQVLRYIGKSTLLIYLQGWSVRMHILSSSRGGEYLQLPGYACAFYLEVRGARELYTKNSSEI
jgi:hypothetical protein